MGKRKHRFQKPVIQNPTGGQTPRPTAPLVTGTGAEPTTAPAINREAHPHQSLRFRDRVLNQTDGILASLLFPVALAAFLIIGVLYKGVEADGALKPFVWMENIVLAFMAGISTYNYQVTAAKLRELPVPLVIFRLNILMMFNAAWFAATVYFNQPTPRLSFIVAIYATFTIANLIQVTKTAHLEKCTARSNAILEASSFLREENGPTMIAYTLMVIAVALHSKFRASEHQYLEAFAGGVAAFHLGLSVVRYLRAIGRSDPATCILNAVEWTGKAVSELNAIPTKSKIWKWWVGGCSLVVGVILVFYFDPSVFDHLRNMITQMRGNNV